MEFELWGFSIGLRNLLEVIATCCGVIAVFMATRRHVWSWPFGAVWASCSVWVYYDSGVLGQSGLHFYFFLVQLWGWWQWSKNQGEEHLVPVRSLDLKGIGICAVASAVLGYFAVGWLESMGSAHSLLDGISVGASIVAQILVVYRYLQCWLMWIMIDVVNIYLCYLQDLNFFMLLNGLYIMLALSGFVGWLKEVREARQQEVEEG